MNGKQSSFELKSVLENFWPNFKIIVANLLDFIPVDDVDMNSKE